ncbi:MAG: hypothetical protein HYW57_01515 [Ignavibacteriales bacterium]|nr:hypothetical protein [Ignavibacteriales bacterium]
MTFAPKGSSVHEDTEYFRASTTLQKDIFRTLLYFDIFDHPLNAAEIHAFLPSNSTTVGEITAACASMPLSFLISHRDGLFFVSRNSGDLLRERLRKERRAQWYWLIARIMGTIIRMFPFVRGVFISGELSKGVMTHRGDIDFFVVTANGRLWVTRTLLILFKKLFLLNSKKFFCLNHFVTENYLDVTERNLFTAMEIATLKPIDNSEFLRTYVSHNLWIKDYLPNLGDREVFPESSHRSNFLQEFLEFPLKGKIGDRLDEYLLSFWKGIWRKRYAHFPAEKRNELFRTEPFLSTAYGGDFLTRILEEYNRRLSVHGLDLRPSND